MSYLDKNAARRPNIAAAAAVIALEVMLVLAVVRGLAVRFMPRDAPVHTYADNVPLPSPTPSALPSPHPRLPDPQPRAAPPLNPPVGGLGQPTDLTPIPLPSPVPLPLPTFQPPQPSPSPIALGTAAVPRGSPGNWVSDSDYPARDLREGNQGRVGFALAIDPDRRVSSCRVTSSSGHAGLDAATCALVPRRARFNPAAGPDGRPRAGSYSGTIRWVIPN